uniref:Uncharacterized protein n=1 Tax=Serinus canaria TaxID=9135 RepID=A0A8C9NFG7_SERCA
MAQFGGQKNPPWATQFTATAVSQPANVCTNGNFCSACGSKRRKMNEPLSQDTAAKLVNCI